MKRHLLATTATDRDFRPGGYSLTATPDQFRKLGHSWRNIEQWAMTGKVHWEHGERERLLGNCGAE